MAPRTQAPVSALSKWALTLTLLRILDCLKMTAKQPLNTAEAAASWAASKYPGFHSSFSAGQRGARAPDCTRRSGLVDRQSGVPV